MPGRPPDPNSKRRNTRVGITVLPAGGRTGRPPKWPLAGRMAAGETAAWRELWKTPQAMAWEALGMTRVVARYCRVLVEAEAPYAKEARAEARQLEDRLGLTPKSMRSLMWIVAETQGDDGEGEAGASVRRSPGPKNQPPMLLLVENTG